MRFARLLYLTFGLCFTISDHTLAVELSGSAATTSPDQQMQQAKAQFNQGAFAQAAVHWMRPPGYMSSSKSHNSSARRSLISPMP